MIDLILWGATCGLLFGWLYDLVGGGYGGREKGGTDLAKEAGQLDELLPDPFDSGK